MTHSRCNIFHVLSAVILVMTATLWPHHHHGDEVCFGTELCDNRQHGEEEVPGHTGSKEKDHGQCSLKMARQSAITGKKADGQMVLPPMAMAGEGATLPPLIRHCSERLEPIPFYRLNSRLAPADALRGPPSL